MKWKILQYLFEKGVYLSKWYLVKLLVSDIFMHLRKSDILQVKMIKKCKNISPETNQYKDTSISPFSKYMKYANATKFQPTILGVKYSFSKTIYLF